MIDPLAESIEAPTEVGGKASEPGGGSTGGDGGGEPQLGEHVEEEHAVGEQVEGEHVEGEHIEGEHVEGEHVEVEHVEGEHVEGEHVEGEHTEGEHTEGEHIEGELQEGDILEGEESLADKQAVNETIEHDGKDMEEHVSEEMEGDQVEDEEAEKKEAQPDEVKEEEEEYVEPPPPDPAEPYNFTDSQEALKPPYELRPNQLAEVEQLWALFQDYTPAYTDLDNYITEKELVFMMKALLVMTYTPEQLQELIVFCVRPSSPEGHILYEQFLKMVTMRQRDFPIEEELRAALCVMDPKKTGVIDREFLTETIAKLGHKMPQKLVNNFIKEVDLANDGTIGIEDVVSTLCIDLNREDIIMLMNIINPPEEIPDVDEIYDASAPIKAKHRSQQNLAEN